MTHEQFPSLSLDGSTSSDSTAGSFRSKAYEIKGYLFSMLTLVLRRADLIAVERQIAAERARLPHLNGEPLVVDLSEVSTDGAALDLGGLIEVVRGLGVIPAGICNGNEAQQVAARRAGIPILFGGAGGRRREPVEEPPEAAAARPPKARPANDPPAAQPSPPLPANSTHIVEAPVRTGQRVFSAGDLTLLASVNPGAEVLAAGSIHVYGPLRGRALAGIAGDRRARIFTRSMEAELVSIAGCFRVLENVLGPEIQGKAAQIFLDGERVVIAPLK